VSEILSDYIIKEDCLSSS